VKFKKDNRLNNILNSRKTYLIILLLLLVYLFLDDRILNEPLSFKITKYILAAFIVLAFCYSRFVKFRQYYQRKFKDKVFVIGAVLIISLFTIFVEAILTIPTNFFIRLNAKNNPVEYYECQIRNVVTTGIDKVHFIFLDRRYSRYVDLNGRSRKELINNYLLVVGVKRSIANSFYLESAQLKEK
jgi:hypothetical protein